MFGFAPRLCSLALSYPINFIETAPEVVPINDWFGLNPKTEAFNLDYPFLDPIISVVYYNIQKVNYY